MRLSRTAETLVRPRDFWIAIAIVVLFLGAMGFHYIQTGHVIGMSPRFVGVFLSILWSLLLFKLIRYRRFLGREAVTLVGYTLFLGKNLWQHPPEAISWAANFGIVIVVLTILLPYFDFTRHNDNPAATQDPLDF